MQPGITSTCLDNRTSLPLVENSIIVLLTVCETEGIKLGLLLCSVFVHNQLKLPELHSLVSPASHYPPLRKSHNYSQINSQSKWECLKIEIILFYGLLSTDKGPMEL